jgi:hypothetical protein
MNLIERVRAILLTPHAEWAVIEQERASVTDLLLKYVAVLAAIPELSHIVGQWLVGEPRASVASLLLRAVVAYTVTFVMVYVIAIVINVLAARCGGERNFRNALKLSVYSHTPLWLAGIFLLIPGLNFLLILGVYGLYLLWVGLPILMQVPTARALRCAVFATACALIPAVVLAIVK